MGLFFEPHTWDGSDFFVPVKTSLILVSERVKQAIEAARCSKVVFTRLDKVRVPSAAPSPQLSTSTDGLFSLAIARVGIRVHPCASVLSTLCLGSGETLPRLTLPARDKTAASWWPLGP